MVSRRGKAERMAELHDLIRDHRAAPFPVGIDKGVDCGRVDPVMIDADIFGWAMRAADAALPSDDLERLRCARDDLESSMSALPQDARPYFARLLKMAELALERS
jgi:hypothetical protein